MRVLVVDDDKNLLRSLKTLLKKEGFLIDLSENLINGYYYASINKYDCLILDVNLPDGNGFNLCRRLRKEDISFPVLILTVNSALNSKVEGLSAGADDYLVKPFAPDELLARVKSLIRRFSTKPHSAYNIGKYSFDPIKRILQGPKIVDLTRMESIVFELLLRFQNRPIPREEILEHFYGEDYPLNNTLDVIINRIRNKIPKETNLKINTVRGFGYVLKI